MRACTVFDVKKHKEPPSVRARIGCDGVMFLFKKY